MPPAYAKVIAVTGGFGSGKSTACELLRQLGATVISADALAKEAVAAGQPILQSIAREFGPEVLLGDGSLNRKKMSEIVFADPERRHRLEAIVHPRVRELADAAFEDALRAGKELIVYDCPLYFEAGLDRLGFRGVIVIDAAPENCLLRVMSRDGISREEAERRIAAQLPAGEKRRRADVIVENNGSIEELRIALSEVMEKFKSS